MDTTPEPPFNDPTTGPGDPASKPPTASDDGMPELDGDRGGPGAGDGGPTGGDGVPVVGRDPLRFSNWMKRSATGAVMTGISIGLREALEQPGNEPALMIEASGQPDDPDHPIRLHFDPDSPADTVAVIRRPRDPDADPPEPEPPTR